MAPTFFYILHPVFPVVATPCLLLLLLLCVFQAGVLFRCSEERGGVPDDAGRQGGGDVFKRLPQVRRGVPLTTTPPHNYAASRLSRLTIIVSRTSHRVHAVLTGERLLRCTCTLYIL